MTKKRTKERAREGMTLTQFHECENCRRAKVDVIQVTKDVGEFLMARMSERTMAVVLTSMSLVLAEEQEDPESAFEDFIRHMRVVWAASTNERNARLAEEKEANENLH